MAKKTITARLCETKPKERIKVYDDRCSGFYVSITPRGVATFSFKYWDGTKQAVATIGTYSVEHLNVDDARTIAFDLKARVGKGENIAKTQRVEKAAAVAASGITVAALIDKYIAYIQVEEMKPWGAMAPRVETWQGIEGYLNRSARVLLGKRSAADITNEDIAELQDNIVKGEYGKPSVSNARNTRNAISGMYQWGLEAGRKLRLKVNPCHNLPKLPAEKKRQRVLTPDEIKTLWWGLDRTDLPCTREVALGLKLELVTMLRSKEFIGSRKDEVKGLGTKDALIQIYAGRVKKRRVINQPLNSLAQEIIAELQRGNKTYFLFPGHGTGGALSEKVLAKAVRGDGDRMGILEFLGMAHWTPHDLRRTAATLAGDCGFDDAEIGRCLDHRSGSNGDDQKVMTVTGEVYNHSKKLKEKRELLDTVDKKLRSIFGKLPRLRLVA